MDAHVTYELVRDIVKMLIQKHENFMKFENDLDPSVNIEPSRKTQDTQMYHVESAELSLARFHFTNPLDSQCNFSIPRPKHLWPQANMAIKCHLSQTRSPTCITHYPA